MSKIYKCPKCKGNWQITGKKSFIRANGTETRTYWCYWNEKYNKLVKEKRICPECENSKI